MNVLKFLRSRRARRFFVSGLVFILLAFLVLTAIGRRVGDSPLPWHLAWLGALGEGGWYRAIDLSNNEGSTKEEVLDLSGGALQRRFHLAIIEGVSCTMSWPIFYFLVATLI